MKRVKEITRNQKRHGIEALLSVLLLFFAVLFLLLYTQSQTVVQVSLEDRHFTEISYNENYAEGYYICLYAFIASAIVFLADIVGTKIKPFLSQNRHGA